MPRITATLYRLREGDPIDNNFIIPVAGYASQNQMDTPNILMIDAVYGTIEEKKDMINKAIESVAGEDNLFIVSYAAVSPLEFPSDKYTLEKEDENDPRELIPVSDVIARELNMFEDLGFEAYPNDTTCVNICIYTKNDNGKKLLDFIINSDEQAESKEVITDDNGGEDNDKEGNEEASEISDWAGL